MKLKIVLAGFTSQIKTCIRRKRYSINRLKNLSINRNKVVTPNPEGGRNNHWI